MPYALGECHSPLLITPPGKTGIKTGPGRPVRGLSQVLGVGANGHTCPGGLCQGLPLPVHQKASCPPSIKIDSPVTKEASSEARKAITAATSSACPNRRRGIFCWM